MKRPVRRLSLRSLWALGGIALLILATLFHFGNEVDSRGRARVELIVNELAALDLSINLETLKLRQGQRLDYDGLVNASHSIDQRLSTLQDEFGKLALKSELALVYSRWLEKQNALDRFKRFHAVFNTSQTHFMNLAEALSKKQSSPRLILTSQRLMAFLIKGGNNDLPLLVSALYQLDQDIADWPIADQVQGKLLVMHASTILANFRDLQSVSQQLLDSPFASDVNVAYRQYAGAHAAAIRVAATYRWGLAVFALFLVGLVIVTLARLRSTLSALGHSHELLDNIADNLGEGIVAFDGESRLVFMNKRAEGLIGRLEADLRGQPLSEVLFAGAASNTNRDLLSAIDAGERFNGEGWLDSKHGRLPVAFLGGPLPAVEGGSAGGYVLSLRDLSENRRTEARLHLAAHVFDSLAEAMVITDERGLIQSVNPAFSSITGFRESEALGHSPGQLLQSGQHKPEFYTAMWQSLRDRGNWQGEVINRRKNGELYTEWLSISALRDSDGGAKQYVGLFSDVSARKEAEAFIHHLAYHDPLTGLANRRLFCDRLDTALRQAQRSNRPLAVLMLDLDRFKVVNDTLGHMAGDQLLKEVGLRLQSSVRDCDTLARFGGDEFAILVPEISCPDDALLIGRKLLLALKASLAIAGRELFASTSIGIAIYPEHGSSGEDLLRNADVALYAAKHAGRNTLSVFDPQAEGKNDDLDIEMGLRHAVERNELVLYYQPQIDGESGLVSGVEALVRWQNPTLGLVSPGRFIPLAEQSSLIDEIGAWCLHEACRQLLLWQAEGVAIPRVAVNVSARQLRGEGFAEWVMETIASYGINPQQLELELTESLLTEDTEHTFGIFKELRAQGIRIAIDDFGTGYSSLKYLADFPVDVLKIDQSFVARLHEQSESLYVVQAMVMLADGLNIETVAEGVETEDQRAQLLALGTNHLQGYLLARPQPAAELAEIVERFTAAAEGKRSRHLQSSPR